MQACERARELSPDVVIMDIALPGASGIEATRRMLKDQPHLRVLMFSMSPDVMSNMAQSAAQPGKSEIEALSPREFEVLRLLVQGATVRSISEKLGLSEKTVANHQSAIREKLGARNSAQLARLAAQMGVSG